MRAAVQIETLLIRHLEALNRANPLFAGSIKIFIPENNLGHEATHMMRMIAGRRDVKTFWQKADRPGICKGANTAYNYVAYVNDLLRSNQLRFSHDLFTVTRGHTPETAKAALQEEMQRYHEEVMLARTDFQRTKTVLTGKTGGMQDDLVIAAMQCIYWESTARTAPPSCFT